MYTCVFCGARLGEKQRQNVGICEKTYCQRCGTYTLPPMFDAMKARYGADEDLHLISGYIREMKELDPSEGIRIQTAQDVADIKSQAPKTVLDRADRFLRTLERITKEPGESVKVNPEDDYPLVYGKNGRALDFFISHFEEMGFLETSSRDSEDWYIKITPKGWIALDNRRARSLDSKKVFVAMAFDAALHPVYEQGIEPAVRFAGYRPVIIRREQFLGKIVDEIIGHIRESRFIVADMTEARGGMYFEGGFAMGLGIPVVWTCRYDQVKDVHFDTRHYNHLAWNDPKDLSEQLYRRIRATIGVAPGTPLPDAR